MIIWNPWHGCHKVSEGCQHCYMYFLDRMRGIKDRKEYRIPDKRVQSRQAYLSGLSFQGRIPQYKLRPAEGSLFDEPIALRTGEFRETCATCGSRLTCNGCSNCGACES